MKGWGSYRPRGNRFGYTGQEFRDWKMRSGLTYPQIAAKFGLPGWVYRLHRMAVPDMEIPSEIAFRFHDALEPDYRREEKPDGF